MKILDQNHSMAKKIGFTPKKFRKCSKIYTEHEKKLYIEHIEVTEMGRGYFKDFLEASNKEGFKIYIPQAPVYLKKIIRKYHLPFDLWVDEDEKLCLDNFAAIHLHWLKIKSNEEKENGHGIDI